MAKCDLESHLWAIFDWGVEIVEIEQVELRITASIEEAMPGHLKLKKWI